MRNIIEGERIDLGGADLHDCNFIECHFYYDGTGFSMVDCDMTKCKFTFTDEAGNTLLFIRKMVEAGWPIANVLSTEVQ